jgi:hypothetical protein
LTVTKTGPACNTCDYLLAECGTWDDNCGGSLECDSLCPGLGTTAWCEQYQWGTCAQYLNDLQYGCCEGSVLRYGDASWDVDCGDYSQECGWRDDAVTYAPLTGYFACNDIGMSDTAPTGVFATCPTGMTWAP